MWESLVHSLLPGRNTWFLIVGGLGPVLWLFVREFRDKQRREEVESPPQEEKLLRPPGHSLSVKLDTIWEDFLTKLLQSVGCGMLSSMFWPMALLFLSTPEYRLWALIPVAPALALVFLTVHYLNQARTLIGKARNYRLGLRGEQAVAEALTEVAAAAGYRIFHDLPGGENWNVDHIVVGPQGVFVIETKARSRRAVSTKQPAHKVGYDAETLYFPTGEDRQAIPQARRNAKWVAEYLTKKTGERVEAAPLVVLPGWYVERAAADTKGVAAMNATYLKKYLASQQSHLPAAQVCRIITALDEKCRDIEF
jgi:hypothetical protein